MRLKFLLILLLWPVSAHAVLEITDPTDGDFVQLGKGSMLSYGEERTEVVSRCY